MNELDWIDLLKAKAKKGKAVLAGIGDDCALVKIGAKKALLKSDLFIEGIHFNRAKTSFKTIGARAVARVLSDFAACAGEPKFIGVSAGIPSYIKEENLKDILEGILSYGKKYKFYLVGGDTSCSRKLFLDVWGVGIAKKFISRSGAKTGDYIFISSKLGQRGFSCTFEPRINEAKRIAKSFKVNAMIDISDGFIIDLYRLLRASKKGALICADSIPTVRGKSDLYRGEDYELLFTIDRKEKKIKSLMKEFYLVGEIRPYAFGYKIKQGKKISKVKVKGYKHF
jgi:thiamine-monophosphate kinase